MQLVECCWWVLQEMPGWMLRAWVVWALQGRRDATLLFLLMPDLQGMQAASVAMLVLGWELTARFWVTSWKSGLDLR